MKIGLVSCSKSKIEFRAPARELYSKSDLFKKALEYAEKNYDKVFILSAKHGLIDPDKVIEPYEKTLKNMTSLQRTIWQIKVFDQMKEEFDFKEVDAIYFHAGKAYRDLIEYTLDNLKIKHHNPLSGLGIGKQKRWYLEKKKAPKC